MIDGERGSAGIAAEMLFGLLRTPSSFEGQPVAQFGGNQ